MKSGVAVTCAASYDVLKTMKKTDRPNDFRRFILHSVTKKARSRVSFRKKAVGFETFVQKIIAP